MELNKECFQKKNYKMVEKYKFSASLALREIHIKRILRFYHTPVRLAKIQNKQIHT